MISSDIKVKPDFQPLKGLLKSYTHDNFFLLFALFYGPMIGKRKGGMSSLKYKVINLFKTGLHKGFQCLIADPSY